MQVLFGGIPVGKVDVGATINADRDPGRGERAPRRPAQKIPQDEARERHSAVRAEAYARSMSVQPEHHGAFGQDTFGRGAERAARFFGTPQYIVGQTLIVIAWIAINSIAVIARWDPYPFILLNLAFSTQAAYAAPLILLAQTRQADRDKISTTKAERRHEEQTDMAEKRVAALKVETDKLEQLLEANTDLTRQDKELTEQVASLTREIHSLLSSSEPRR